MPMDIFNVVLEAAGILSTLCEKQPRIYQQCVIEAARILLTLWAANYGSLKTH
jgi:hypothetical protein